MARIEPLFTKTKSELLDQIAQLTQSMKTDVIKNVLAVYYEFVRHAVTRARVIDCKPTEEEVEMEIPEIIPLEAEGHRLSPGKFVLLAKRLAEAKNHDEAARLRESITRGFYGSY